MPADDNTDEPDQTEPTDTATTDTDAKAKRGNEIDEDAIVRIVAAVVRRVTTTLTGFGALVLILELLADTVPPKWGLVAIGSAIALTIFNWARSRLRPEANARHPMVSVIIGVAVFGLVVGYLVRPLGDRIEQWLVDCDDPVELTVLLPVDGAAGFQDSIAAFNREYVDKDQCRKANVTAYSAPWPQVEQAMAEGWETRREDDATAPFASLRDVGPRPHFWIAESRTHVDLAFDALDGSELNYEVFQTDDAEPIGRTPLVLAVPDTLIEAGFNGGKRITDRPLSDLITELGEVHGTPVLRSDPAVTTSGLLFVRALYGPDAVPGGVGARMENQLADAAAETGIASSPSDTDLLCDLARSQGVNPTAAVLTTEGVLARYNSGYSLGDDCAVTESGRSGLMPVYSKHFGSLDYQGVTLEWSGDPLDGERAEVADDLRAWLAGERRWKPTSMGVRGADYDGGEIDGDAFFEKDFDVEADPISAGEFRELQNVYGQNRPPTTVLLAIDHSQTMDEPVSGGQTRFDLATAGVETALQYLGANPDDKAALWTFPVPGEGSHHEVFGMTSDPGEDVAGLLAATETSEGVDLHQTVVDGIVELEATGAGDGASAMVVLTDGADQDRSQTTVENVQAALAESRAQLYLIAVGEASCRSATFAALTADARVTCLEAEEERITVTFDILFNQLWSGNA